MKANEMPPAQYLRECLAYDPNTGALRWLARPLHHFYDSRAHKTWNTRFSGTEAFTVVRVSQRGGTAHFYGTLDYKHYFAHRIIWKWMTGEEPAALVDHEDQNSLNNKWGNLRAATKGQNNINATNAERGIWFDRRRNKWAASVHQNKKQFHAGRFNTKEEALRARHALAIKLFGEFVP